MGGDLGNWVHQPSKGRWVYVHVNTQNTNAIKLEDVFDVLRLLKQTDAA